MSRARRLLDLLQRLNGHRRPVTAAALAADLGVSVRTLYRDVAALQAQGARIEGEPGLGYVLRPGFLLPPLMFTEEELSALVLGARWVAERGDGPLAAAAVAALSKIGAVLPAPLREGLEAPSLMVPPSRADDSAASLGERELPRIRAAIRAEHKLRLTYRDEAGRETERTVWPISLAYFDHARVVAAHCELRGGFRHFRIDRIAALAVVAERYPRRRRLLLAEWRAAVGVDGEDRGPASS